MSGSQWYFAIDENRQGPVSSADLRKLAQLRKLKPTDLVWKEGMSDWVAAGTISGLFETPKRVEPKPIPEKKRVRSKSTAERPAPFESEESAFFLPEGPKRRKRKRVRVNLDTASLNVPLANFWPRVGAALIDLFLKAVLLMTISHPLRGIIVTMLRGRYFSWEFRVIAGNAVGLMTAIVLLLIYDVLQETSDSQATIGKSKFGLQVVDLDGERISRSTAFARHFGRYLSVATLGFGFLMALWTRNRQTLHDRLAGTYVIQQGRGP